MTTSVRSLRLIAFDATRLNTLSSERGEIFFDQTSGTLRFFDARTGLGQLMATRAWVQSNPSGLPTQTGNSGKILTTNGTALSWVTPTVYSLPTASTSVLGGVKVDGSTITISGGVISGANTYTLPTASTTVLGGVKVDGSTITINGSGVISGANTYSLPTATNSVLGGVKVDGSTITISNGTITATYSLPVASASVLGGVKQGSNVTIDGAGVISVAAPYSLPVASASVLGGVKQGSNVTIDGAGVISVATGAGYTLPTSSNTVLGGVKVDASSITINGSGVISVPAVATIGASNGIAQLGSDGKLVSSQIPSSLSGAIVFKGTWNASTNTPTLADGSGTNGWEYAVSVGGTRNLGSGNITFTAGDYVIYNGTIWQQIPSSTIAAAGTLTGTTLNATVVTSSLTSVGTLTNLQVTNTITGSISGNAGTVTNGVYTSSSYADPSWITSLAASKVGLGNVTNESKATMFASPTFTGTVTGVTATHVGLGNVTNESKATMFASPTFTGTVAGVTATHVGLGNVTNESKATMFASPTFTGTVSGVTKAHVGLGSVENTALSTWAGSTNITTLGTVTVGSAPASDVYAWAKAATKPTYTATDVGLSNVTNESKATMFSSPTFTGTVTGVTATHVGLGNVTNESKTTMFASPTFTGTVTGVTATHVGLGNVTNESKATMFSSPTFTGTVTGVTATHVGLGLVENTALSTWAGSTNITTLGTITSGSASASFVGLGNVTNESKDTMFTSPTFTGTVSGVTANMISGLKYAKTELIVTNVANAGYRINYPDYSSSNNPIVYATAGETLAFNLNGISGNHPFLIQVNVSGTWSNYDLGLYHVGNIPTAGTVNTGTNAQGKSTGMLYWVLPPDIAPGDYRYICSIHFNMTGTIRVKGADQSIFSIRSNTPTNVDFGTSWGTVNSTYYKWDIPAAGTYLVWGTFRARTWGTSGFAKIRLYNQTAGTVVTDSDTMLLENQNSLSLNAMCTANWRYVATVATTLYLQGFATAGSGCGIQSDSNGYNECGFIRIT